jgi:4-hydroxythreonine-4-phosphate dehydrogenase
MTSIPRIILTAGEPAGIGPDLLVRVAQQDHNAELVAVCAPELLTERASILGLPLALQPFDTNAAPRVTPAGQLSCRAVDIATAARCGQLDTNNANYVLETLRVAADLCLNGYAQAMVTAPVHKGVINDAGIAFTGHTEFLAALSGSPQPVMMLTTSTMRVALATTHLPLRQVSSRLSQQLLLTVFTVLAEDLHRWFGLGEPRIQVCGLNPHAGEGGHLGDEEILTIEPAVTSGRERGLNLTGPVPADTAFVSQRLQDFDATVAMYHDQGLPVLKHQGFGSAVNITLGLPFIRTSVDHGTALDLAGTDKPDIGSMVAALKEALAMIEHTQLRGSGN